MAQAALRWHAPIAGETAAGRSPARSSMQVLFDVLPVIVFFVVYRFYGIYAATVAIIVTMALQIAYQWFRSRQGQPDVPRLRDRGRASLAAITLALRNPTFHPVEADDRELVVCGRVSRQPVHRRQDSGRAHHGSRRPARARVLATAQFDVGRSRSLGLVPRIYTSCITSPETIWVDFKLFGMTGSAVARSGRSSRLDRAANGTGPIEIRKIDGCCASHAL